MASAGLPAHTAVEMAGTTATTDTTQPAPAAAGVVGATHPIFVYLTWGRVETREQAPMAEVAGAVASWGMGEMAALAVEAAPLFAAPAIAEGMEAKEVLAAGAAKGTGPMTPVMPTVREVTSEEAAPRIPLAVDSEVLGRD